MGLWLKDYGKAIYSTRITPVYQDGKIWFTADKDKEALYAIYPLEDGETLPDIIEWEGNEPKGNIHILKGNKKVKYTYKKGKVIVTLPKGLKDESLAFSFKAK